MFKWWSIIFLVIPVLFILCLYLWFGGFYFVKSNEYSDLLTESINASNLIGWVFGGIMALLGFLTLFIAFSYENKLSTASKIKQQILKPYALNLEEIILNINEYNLYLSKDFLLNFIYWVFLIVSSVSILSWGIIIGCYTNFELDLTNLISYKQLMHLIIVIIWLSLSFILLSITILLNFVRFKKDPFHKGYLIKESQLSDVEFLKENNGDLQELLFKISPEINILKNPPKDTDTYELSIFFPLKFSNMRFVVKIYSPDREVVSLRINGLLKEIERVGQGFSYIFTNELDLKNLQLNEQSHGIMKFYDKNNKLISLIKLKAEKEGETIRFNAGSKEDLKFITNDNDFREFAEKNDEFLEYCTLT